MTYRNRALLDLCHEAPCLLLPGQHECSGPSEPCHSDMIRHGRGEHHKSHDCFAPPGCHNAHLAFTRSNLGKEGYFQAWVEAMERYILWQWVSGKVRLADITQRPKEPSMEPPKCRLCEKNHWAREGCNFGKTTKPEKEKTMPKGTKVDKVYKALKKAGKSTASAAKIAQAKTGQALKTGKPPKAGK